MRDSEKYTIKVTVGGENFYFEPMDQEVGNYARFNR
jgi:hypothetical protein